MAKKLYIIDGSSCFYRAFHAIPRFTNSKGLPTNAVYGFTQTLRKILKQCSPDYVAVAFDVKGPSFRHELYERYKIERPPMPDDLAVQIPYVKKVTEALNIAVLERQGFEADDVIGTVVERVAGAENVEVVIVTGDKDMMQLVGERVTVYDFVKEKTYGSKEVEEKLGVLPERVVDFMALSGDPTDSIPGVRGIGPKTALKLIGEFGTLDNLLLNVDSVKQEKVREALKAHATDATLSRELASIRRDVPLDFRLEDLVLRNPDYETLEPLFSEMEFTKLIAEMIPRKKAVTASFERVSGANELDAASAKLKDAGRVYMAMHLSEDAGEARPGVKGIAVVTEGEKFLAYLDLCGNKDKKEQVKKLSQAFEAGGLLKYVDDAKPFYSLCKSAGIVPAGVVLDSTIASYLINPERVSMEKAAFDLLGERVEEPPKDAGEDELVGAIVERARLLSRLAPKLEEALDTDVFKKLFTEIELPLCELLSEMELCGIKTDRKKLETMSIEMEAELKRLEEEIYKSAGYEFNINSPKQLSELLFTRLGLKPVKKTKTGYSTDESVLSVLAEKHPVPAAIINFRQLSKLKSTYVDGLLNVADISTGRVHTTFNQTVTATGRLSSSNPNLQNIPVKGSYAGRIREAFIAEDGFSLVAADYSQIELRLVAHLSGDELLLDSFLKGEDIHTRTASEVFGLLPGLVTKDMRRKAKAINFGIIYGMGPHGLSAELKVSMGEAKAYIDAYFARYKGVKAFIDKTIAEARERGYTETIFGRRRYVPELNAGSEQAVRFGERIAVNTPVQGSAADVIKAAMLRVDKALKQNYPQSRLILQIHDELVVEARTSDVDAVSNILSREMSDVMELKVPLTVNVSVGTDWQKAG